MARQYVSSVKATDQDHSFALSYDDLGDLELDEQEFGDEKDDDESLSADKRLALINPLYGVSICNHN